MADVRWGSDTPELFSATFALPWDGRRYLVVEALPDGGWDWVAWADDGDRRYRSGVAPTLGRAMSDAEQAAVDLPRHSVIDLSAVRRGLQIVAGMAT